MYRKQKKKKWNIDTSSVGKKIKYKGYLISICLTNVKLQLFFDKKSLVLAEQLAKFNEKYIKSVKWSSLLIVTLKLTGQKLLTYTGRSDKCTTAVGLKIPHM